MFAQAAAQGYFPLPGPTGIFGAGFSGVFGIGELFRIPSDDEVAPGGPTSASSSEAASSSSSSSSSGRAAQEADPMLPILRLAEAGSPADTLHEIALTAKSAAAASLSSAAASTTEDSGAVTTARKRSRSAEEEGTAGGTGEESSSAHHKEEQKEDEEEEEEEEEEAPAKKKAKRGAASKKPAKGKGVKSASRSHAGSVAASWSAGSPADSVLKRHASRRHKGRKAAK